MSCPFTAPSDTIVIEGEVGIIGREDNYLITGG